MPEGKINVYFCPKCLRPNITRDKDEGTTPMFTICFEDDCDGQATSAMYMVRQTLHPSHEWYTPDEAERAGIKNLGALDHVEQGGLLLREISPLPIDSQLDDLQQREESIRGDTTEMDLEELRDHYVASMLSWGNAVDQLTVIRARFRLARGKAQDAKTLFLDDVSVDQGRAALNEAVHLLRGGDIDSKDATLWVRNDGVWCHRFTIHSAEGEGEGNTPFDVAKQMKAATDQPPQEDLEVLPVGEVPR